MLKIFKRKKSPEILIKLLKESLSLQTRSSRSKFVRGRAQSVIGISTTKKSSSSCDLQDDSLAQNSSDLLASELLVKRLKQIKLLLYESEDESKCQVLALAFVQDGYLLRLIDEFHLLSFEARKIVSLIYSNIMKKNLGRIVSYIEKEQTSILFKLLRAYENRDIALHCGSMLRDSVRYERLTRILLYSNDVWKLFDKYVHLPHFDIASDALATLGEILLRHKQMAFEFYTEKFDLFFEKYHLLLLSDNYVTKRQSLKLLGEILLDRVNFNIMMKYISRKENLKILMNMLRDKSGSIQFEAFHIFKVFVANPEKPSEVVNILFKNKEKLIVYLTNFQAERSGDEQFMEEKNLLIKTLETLEGKAELNAN